MDIALVGIGKIARDQHVPAIRESADWRLAATVSRSGTVDGVPAYDDMEAMLSDNPGIRVVSLCMPPVPRFAYARQALLAGRHVMLEKPPGAGLAECYALAEIARAQGLSLYATWHSRRADMVPAAKAWLADKTLRRLQITWKEDVRRWHPGQDWIWQAGGMGVFDPGINALSILSEILPEPVHVQTATLEVPENCQTPIAARMGFWHSTAEVGAEFDFRQEGEQIWQIEAETDEGRMCLSDGGARLAIDGVPGGDAAPLGGEYPRLYDDMARLVSAGGCDMDLAPLRHVADAFMLGERVIVEAFHD